MNIFKTIKCVCRDKTKNIMGSTVFAKKDCNHLIYIGDKMLKVQKPDPCQNVFFEINYCPLCGRKFK